MKRKRHIISVVLSLPVLLLFAWSTLALHLQLKEQAAYMNAEECTSSKQTDCLEARHVVITYTVKKAAFKNECEVNMEAAGHRRYTAGIAAEKCSGLLHQGSLVFMRGDTMPRSLVIVDTTYNLYDGEMKIAIKAVLCWVMVIGAVFMAMRFSASGTQKWPYMLHPHRMIAGCGLIFAAAIATARSPRMLNVLIACILTTCLVEYVAFLIRKR